MKRKPAKPKHEIQFGGVLRAARVRAGVTQEQLAHRAGVSVKYISHLETGTRANPSWQTIENLARAMGMTTSDLFCPGNSDGKVDGHMSEEQIQTYIRQLIKTADLKELLAIISLFDFLRGLKGPFTLAQLRRYDAKS